MAEVSVLKINNTSYNIKDKQAVRFYDNVAAMISDTTIKNGQTLRTLGYYAINDGGGALYKVVSSVPSGHYETLQNNFYAQYIIEDRGINIKSLGAYGDYLIKSSGAYVVNGAKHDDTEKFIYAVNIAKQSINKTIFLPAGIYWLTGPILVGEGVHIVGEGSPTPPLYGSDNWDYGNISGAIVAITSDPNVLATNEGSTFKLTRNSGIDSLGFWYPNQFMKNLKPYNNSTVDPIVYSPSILIMADPVTQLNPRDIIINNCYFCNPYTAIDASAEHSGLKVSNIIGFAVFCFLIVDNCTDVDRFLHIQLNTTKAYKSSWPNGNLHYWQTRNAANNNCGILLKKADAPLFSDVAVIGFAKGFNLRSSNNNDASTGPNGALFIDCMAEWCLYPFYLQAAFTWIKLHHCSFGTLHEYLNWADAKDSNGDWAFKKTAISITATAGGHVILDDVRIWHSYEKAIEINSCYDIAMNNVTVDGMEAKIHNSNAVNSCLTLSNCTLIRANNLKLSYITPSGTIPTIYNSAVYLYLRGVRGFVFNNILCSGLNYDNVSRDRISLSTTSTGIATKVGKITNIVANHPLTIFKASSTTDVTLDTPIAGTLQAQ